MKAQELFRSILMQARLWLAGLLVLFVVWAVMSAVRLPKPPLQEQAFITPAEWVDVPEIQASLWESFGSPDDSKLQAEGPLSARYRLAGTFFTYQASPGQKSMRKAVIDDLDVGRQHLVGEGDRMDSVEVMNIYEDHAVLRGPGGEEEIWLGFAGSGASSLQEANPAEKQAGAEDGVLAENRFGKQVGTNRWVFQRAALMDYYREVLEDPERVASIYLSLKPDYQEDNRIGGYILDVEGEGEFFEAVGLLPGDVIRSVNSMKMTNQRRAEYFLREFYQERLGVVVMDIEREGVPQKQIYMFR